MLLRAALGFIALRLDHSRSLSRSSCARSSHAQYVEYKYPRNRLINPPSNLVLSPVIFQHNKTASSNLSPKQKLTVRSHNPTSKLSSPTIEPLREPTSPKPSSPRLQTTASPQAPEDATPRYTGWLNGMTDDQLTSQRAEPAVCLSGRVL